MDSEFLDDILSDNSIVVNTETPEIQKDALNRREALKRLGKWGFKATWMTAAFSGGNLAVVLVHSIPLAKQANTQESDLKKAETDGGPVKVSIFANEIATAGLNVTESVSKDALIGMLAGFFSGVFSGVFLEGKSKQVFKKIGAISGFSGKTIDIISTMIGLRMVNDPRFKEYGLDSQFNEGNFFFSEQPSEKELAIKGAIFTAIMANAGYNFPNLGRGYLGLSPFLAVSNYEAGVTIGICLKIGDKVKEMIKEGQSAESIKKYLESLTAEEVMQIVNNDQSK